MARVRAVLRRVAEAGEQRPEGAIELGEVRLDPDRRSTIFQGDEPELSRKEFDLLRLLMENAGSVVTRERLIDEVWDTNWFGSTKTLDVHVSGLPEEVGRRFRRSALHPHRPRRRLPLRRRRRAVSRTRLPAAFAYVLILVIVALEVPLILNVSRRVDTEVKAGPPPTPARRSQRCGRAGHSRHPRPSPDRSARRRGCRRPRSRRRPRRHCSGRLGGPDRELRRQAGDPGGARRRNRAGAPVQRDTR